MMSARWRKRFLKFSHAVDLILESVYTNTQRRITVSRAMLSVRYIGPGDPVRLGFTQFDSGLDRTHSDIVSRDQADTMVIDPLTPLQGFSLQFYCCGANFFSPKAFDSQWLIYDTHTAVTLTFIHR